jgi:hypothetical protein
MQEKEDLVVEVEIQAKCYNFFLGSCANCCLVQLHIGDFPIEKNQHKLRVVTGDLLEMSGSRKLRVSVGNQCYCHNFVIFFFWIFFGVPNPSGHTRPWVHSAPNRDGYQKQKNYISEE